MSITLPLRHAIEVQMVMAKLPKLAPKQAYWLGKIGAKCASHGRAFEKERNKLIRKFGELNENTKQVGVIPSKFEEYSQEVEQLMDSEVILDNVDPVSVDSFVNKDGQPVEIEPLVMASLEPIMQDSAANDEKKDASSKAH